MQEFYLLLGVVSGMIVYDVIKYMLNRLFRRWGENPSDATYGGK